MEEAAELANYLPLSFKTPKKQDYIAFLWDAFETNYTHGTRCCNQNTARHSNRLQRTALHAAAEPGRCYTRKLAPLTHPSWYNHAPVYSEFLSMWHQ